MRIKKIISLCKESKVIALFWDEEREAQWLSNGDAAYLLDNDMPLLDTEALCKLYDINDKAQEKSAMIDRELPSGIDFRDNIDEESEAEPLGVSVIYNGGILEPLMTEEGILYVERAYLEPLTDSPTDTWRLTLRHDNRGKPFIVVKIGLFVSAVIYTYKMPELFVEKLETLFKQTELAISIEKKREANAAEDPDTERG